MKVKSDVNEGLYRFMKAIENDTDKLDHLKAVDDNGCSIVHLLTAHGFERQLDEVDYSQWANARSSTWGMLSRVIKLMLIEYQR